MKKLFILGLFFVVLFGQTAVAANLRVGERYVLPPDHFVTGDFYAAGGDIRLDGDISDDVAAAGNTVTLKSSVGGDILVVGGTVVIDSAVVDDVRALGGTITISSSVGGDVAVAGGTIHLVAGSSVGGDLLVAGGTVIIDGDVAGHVQIAGGTATISGSVGSVLNYAENLTLASTARVAQDVVNRSPSAVIAEEGATVGAMKHDPAIVQPRSFLIAGGTVGFLAFLFTGLACLWLFKNRSMQFTSHALAHFGKEFLRGIICLIAIPIFALLLCLTFIGFPIGVIILAHYIALIILAKVFAGIMFGGWINKVIFKKPDQVFTWQTVIGGNVLLLGLRLIPVVGGVIYFIFTLVAFGAFWGYIHRHFWRNR